MNTTGTTSSKLSGAHAAVSDLDAAAAASHHHLRSLQHSTSHYPAYYSSYYHYYYGYPTTDMLQQQQQAEATPPSEQSMSSLDHNSSVTGSPFHSSQNYNLGSNLTHDYDLSAVASNGNVAAAGSNSSSSIGSGAAVAVSTSIRDMNQHQQPQHEAHQQAHIQTNGSQHQQDSEGNYSTVLPSLLPGTSSYAMTPLQDYTSSNHRPEGIHAGSPGGLPTTAGPLLRENGTTRVVTSDAVAPSAPANNLISE